MALLDMKRLIVLLPLRSQKSLLRELAKLGCVEVERCPDSLLERYGAFVVPEAASNGDSERSVLMSAKKLLDKIAPSGGGIFPKLPEVTENELYSDKLLYDGLAAAREILSLRDELSSLEARENELRLQIKRFEPWCGLELPLNFEGTRRTVFFKGTLPAARDLGALDDAVFGSGLPCCVWAVGADERLKYVCGLALRERLEDSLKLLRDYGYAPDDISGSDTAENLAASLRDELSACIAERKARDKELHGKGDSRLCILKALDALSRRDRDKNAADDLATAGHTSLMLGWLPAESCDAVAATLDKVGCAYEFRDPEQDEDPPTASKNGKFAAAFEPVTEMYGTSAYGSSIDPTPFFTIFYIVFFGFMMADIGYGLLITLGCALALKKLHPRGNTRKMLQMFFYCGIGTIFAGILTGSFFGDFLSSFTGVFFGKSISLPVLMFDPLAEPIKMLILSLALGLVQILAGIGVAGLRQIRQGDVFGAICDSGSWYLIAVGGGLMALGVKTVGLVLIGCGVALLLAFGGRAKKGFGRVTGGLKKIYDVIGYASDMLSYSRIMALCLSGAVVAQVFNKIGSMAGSGIFGLIVFLLAFLIGHAFNLLTGLLGAYVHTSRLQYIEYFGKFFADGGHAFRPLCNKTNFTEITKEE